jgi:hypothetical protein
MLVRHRQTRDRCCTKGDIVLTGILVFMVIFSATSVFADDSTKAGQPVVSDDDTHFSQRFSRGRDVIVVDLRVRPFQKARHKLRLVQGAVQKVDGREPHGIDGGPPEGLTSEVVSIAVSWNGTRRSVDRVLFSDCFNTSAHPRVLISDDFKAVMLTSYGGDAGGAYGVHWVVPKSGDIVRFMVGTDELTWQLPTKALQRTALAASR